MSDLKDKVVVITGASDGIGAKIAEKFAEQGSRLALCGRSQEKLEIVAARCVQAGLDKSQVYLVTGDLLLEEEVNAMTSRIIDHYRQIDVLVNNGGVASSGGIEESRMQDYDAMFKIHIRAVVSLIKAFLPLLKASKGNIVNISSDSGTITDYPLLAYSIMKAAQDHLTRCMAVELAPQGVRVNGVNPGVIQTDIFVKSSIVPNKEEQDKLFAMCDEKMPLRRVGKPEDVADAVVFLASNKASYVTGAKMPVDGGSTVWYGNVYN